jgi:amidohydrolase
MILHADYSRPCGTTVERFDSEAGSREHERYPLIWEWTVTMTKASLILASLLVFAAPLFTADIDGALEPELDSLEQLYLHLHRNPELSFHERETASRIAKELEAAGYEVTTGVGGTGVVAVLENGAGKTVMVRTDLDGLPVTENTGRPYASTIRVQDSAGADVGVMHACGHDMHMTSFIGTARTLAKLKDEWSGTLVFIGQPAEERGAGARAMLKDGLYSRFPKPDYVLGLHVSAELPAGTIGYRPGYVLANVDSVDIKIHGVGGHGAYPHKTKDPIVLAAQVIMGLQTIASRETDPQDAVVITVGSIHGGTKHNIIPPEVNLQLTVRSYADETRAHILDSIKRITMNTARAFGMPEDRLPEVTFQDEFTPSTYNNPELTKRLLPIWQSSLGAENVIEVDPVMAGEDFSEYGRTTDKIPISIMWLGTVDEERFKTAKQGGAPLPPLHSPLFWPAPHPTIKTGVKATVAAALELLQ